MHIRVRLAGPAVEGAKGADDVTDVRVIDVAVDDIGDERRVVFAPTDLVGSDTDAGDIARLEESGAVVGREAFSGEGFVENRLDRTRHYRRDDFITRAMPTPRA
jgi:hypothetical protein